MSGTFNYCWILGLFKTNNFAFWPQHYSSNILFIIKVSRAPVFGPSINAILQNKILECYPIMDGYYYINNTIAFIKNKGIYVGPYWHCMADIDKLHQLPNNNNQNIENKFSFSFMNNNNFDDLCKLYKQTICHMQLLRNYLKEEIKFGSISVCHIISRIHFVFCLISHLRMFVYMFDRSCIAVDFLIC